jgi:hypothetical protein
MANPIPEPPALAAERDKLMAELQKQAKTATGPTQTVLKKLYEVLAQTKPGATANPQVFTEAKAAFAELSKAKVDSPPPVIMQTLEFMQKRSAAMSPPPAAPAKSAPPARSAPPPARSAPSLASSPPPPSSTANPRMSGAAAASSFGDPPPRGAPSPRRPTSDGFEMKRTMSSVSLKPPDVGAGPAGQKTELGVSGKPKPPGAK